MKKQHSTDGFLSSETAFCNAAAYWETLFKELKILPCTGWRVSGVHRFLNGSCDMSSGVVMRTENLPAKKSLRLSQSERTEKGFLLVHTGKMEFDGVECDSLNLHCCPTPRIEGLIVLFVVAWLGPECTPQSIEAILQRFMPSETFEDGEDYS